MEELFPLSLARPLRISGAILKERGALRALAVTALLLIGTSRVLLAQAAAIPLALGVSASSSETTVGGAVPPRVQRELPSMIFLVRDPVIPHSTAGCQQAAHVNRQCLNELRLTGRVRQ